MRLPRHQKYLVLLPLWALLLRPVVALAADDQWRNYGFDTVKTGLLDAGDSAANSIASGFFEALATLVHHALRIFSFCIDFDITEIFRVNGVSVLDTIQQHLMSSIFGQLFILGFVVVAWRIAVHHLQHNTVGMATDMAQLFLVAVLAAFVATHTATVLSAVTGIAKDLALSVVVEVNDDGEQRGVEDYVAQTVDVLWDDLIHEPWEALNFGDMGVAYSEEEAEALLALSPGSDERQAAATSFIASHPGAEQTMAKASGWGRIGQIIVYLPLLLVKLLVYVGCSLVMLVQQVVVVFFALLAPLVLLLALSETFGGFKIIRVWAQQMIESELMIVITMLLLALLMRIGAGLRDLSSTLGWLAGAMLQAGLVVILFLMRRSIFRVIGRVVGYRAIRQVSNNAGNAGILLMGTFRDLGQDREARRQRQLQAERDAKQDEMIEAKTYNQQLRNRGQELRNERLEYQNEWDREHPNANPHDRYYHHYYTPRPTAEEREDGQEHQEPPERPYRRPRSAETPRQGGATEPPRPAPDQTRDTPRPRAEEAADAPRPRTEASDAARPGAATNAPRPQGEGYTPGGYAEPVPPPPPETPGQPEHPRPKAEPWEDGEDKPELWEDK